MVSDEDDQSPFTRPRFIVAAAMLFLIIAGGVGIAIFGGNKEKSPTATPTPTATLAVEAEPDASTDVLDGSVCGLEGQELDGKVSKGPEADWDYQGVMAYPSSEEYGPAAEENYRYCFQRSPEGAVFAAANADEQCSDLEIMLEWLNNFVADTPEGKQWLHEVSDEGSLAGSRTAIAGFRLLEYDGMRSRVDMASRVTVDGQTSYVSIIYPLVWEDGDWKLEVTDAEAPTDVAQLPDLAGYVAWSQ